MVKINEGQSDFSRIDTGLEAFTELGATALFVAGTFRAARAAVRAIQSGHPIEAVLWSGAALGGAMTAGILGLDTAESVGSNMQHNRTASHMSQPAAPAKA